MKTILPLKPDEDKTGRGYATLFRTSLTKLLPGYNWTVHKQIGPNIQATGIQSSGFNRCSTIQVVHRLELKWFEARIAGYGKHSQWLQSGSGGTLAQAIRSLQSELENKASIYSAQASTLQEARSLQNTPHAEAQDRTPRS